MGIILDLCPNINTDAIVNILITAIQVDMYMYQYRWNRAHSYRAVVQYTLLSNNPRESIYCLAWY